MNNKSKALKNRLAAILGEDIKEPIINNNNDLSLEPLFKNKNRFSLQEQRYEHRDRLSLIDKDK